MKDLFEWTVASVTGHYHHQTYGFAGQTIPCQDAHYIDCTDDSLLLLVVDGFSGNPFTSLSHLGAPLVMQQAAKRLRFLLAEAMQTEQPAQTFIRQLGDVSDLIRSDIDRLARRMFDAYQAQALLTKLLDPKKSVFTPSYGEVLTYAFLFTLVGVVITKEWTVAFACGDGEIHFNGVRHGQPDPLDGRPDTLTDGILDPTTILSGRCDLQLVMERPTLSVDTLVIGTDGLGPLYGNAGKRLFRLMEPVPAFARLWQEDRYFTEPDTLRCEWLNRTLPGSQPPDGLILEDDVTAIIVRRRPVPEDQRDTLPSPANNKAERE